MEPPWSLSALSLVLRPTVAPPCLNKGNLPLLRSSFLFLPQPELYLTFLVLNPGKGRGTRLTLSHCFPFSRSLGAWTSAELTFLPGLKFPSGTPSAFVSGFIDVLRTPRPRFYPLSLSLSLSDDLQNRELLPFDWSTCNTPLKPAPRLR